MAKSDDKNRRNEARETASNTLDNQAAYRDTMEQKRQQYETQSNAERQALLGSIQPNLGTTGGLDQTVVGNIRGLYPSVSPGAASSSTSSGGGGGDSGGGGGGGTTAAPSAGLFDESERAFRDINTESQASIGRMRAQVDELQAMAKTGAMDPAAAASVQAIADKLKNFQFNPQAAAEIKADIAQLKQYGASGGVDPRRLAQLESTADMMMSGGISDADLARWRGTGYSEFAETGGWSAGDRADYRDRATSVIPAMYQQQMADAARMRNVGGGNAGGFLAGASRLNRQSSQDMVKAARDAEIDLGHEVREGRKWGIEGLATTEKDIQAQQGQNRQAGLASGVQLETDIANNRINATQMAGQLNVDFNDAVNNAFIQAQSGAGTIEANMAKAVADNKVRAQEAAATAEGVAQRLRTEAQQASAQGLFAIANAKQQAADRAAATGAAARAADQANARWYAGFVADQERWIGEQQMQGQQAAQRNAITLYGMDPTLDRDRFGMDLDNSLVRNAGMVNEMNSGGGIDWSKWAGLGIGGAQTFGLGGGGGGGGGIGGGGYEYDSDNPNSFWYAGGGSGDNRNTGGVPIIPDPSEWD